MLVVAVGPVVGVGIAVLDVNTNAVEFLSHELRMAIADDVARTLEEEIQLAEQGLEAVALVLTTPALPEAEAIEVATRAVGANAQLDHVALYDRDCRLIDTIRTPAAKQVAVPAELDATVCQEAWKGKTAYGAVHSAADGPRISVSTPVRSADQTIRGLAATALSLAPLQRRVEHLASIRLAGAPASLFIVDEQFRVVAHSGSTSAAQVVQESTAVCGHRSRFPRQTLSDVRRVSRRGRQGERRHCDWP